LDLAVRSAFEIRAIDNHNRAHSVAVGVCQDESILKASTSALYKAMSFLLFATRNFSSHPNKLCEELHTGSPLADLGRVEQPSAYVHCVTFFFPATRRLRLLVQRGAPLRKKTAETNPRCRIFGNKSYSNASPPACDFLAQLARFIRLVLFHDSILFPVLDNITTDDNQTLGDTAGAICWATVCVFSKPTQSFGKVSAI
jgi:hypothetical protein